MSKKNLATEPRFSPSPSFPLKPVNFFLSIGNFDNQEVCL